MDGEEYDEDAGVDTGLDDVIAANAWSISLVAVVEGSAVNEDVSDQTEVDGKVVDAVKD